MFIIDLKQKRVSQIKLIKQYIVKFYCSKLKYEDLAK